MAKMKIEFLHHYHRRHGLTLRDRLIAWLPRYAPLASRLGRLLNLRDTIPGLAALSEKLTGFTAKRPLPRWHAEPFRNEEAASLKGGTAGEVVLFVDCFTRWQEPQNARAALAVLDAAGYRVHIADAGGDERPLCCGRTFLAVGQVEETRVEARRMLEALTPFVMRGVPVVGLEPSCLLTLRDEYKAILPGAETDALAGQALLFEEFLARAHKAGSLSLPLGAIPQKKALVHGHCHQKAHNALSPVETVLKLVPGLEVDILNTTCCGGAGAFGYQAEHYETSMKIGELSVLPVARAAGPDAVLVADGTSCRHQIDHGAKRRAVHAAVLLQSALLPSEQ